MRFGVTKPFSSLRPHMKSQCGASMKRLMIIAIALGAPIVQTTSAQTAFPGPTFKVQDIPWRLRMGAFQGKLRAGLQEGYISFTAAHKKVNIRWTSSAITNEEPDWNLFSTQFDFGNNAVGSSKFRSDDQVVTAGFYVTACGRLNDSTLLVGGINRVHGGAIVEQWTFDWPPTMPSPVLEDGFETVEIVHPGVQRTVVYSDAPLTGAPRQYVSGLCGLRDSGGPTNTALVQFDNPNDVLVLDLGTGVLTLLASESDASALFGATPSLAIKEYSAIKILNHSSAGYVYFLLTGSPAISTQYGGASLDDDDQRLHLLDSDRDGVVDAVVAMSTNEAESQGYLDLTDYEDWWME